MSIELLVEAADLGYNQVRLRTDQFTANGPYDALEPVLTKACSDEGIDHGVFTVCGVGKPYNCNQIEQAIGRCLQVSEFMELDPWTWYTVDDYQNWLNEFKQSLIGQLKSNWPGLHRPMSFDPNELHYLKRLEDALESDLEDLPNRIEYAKNVFLGYQRLLKICAEHLPE